MTDDTRSPFQLRHQARRAALLAAQLRRMWDVLLEEDKGEFLIGEAAARMSDEAWINIADTVAIQTGKPFHPPSETTKAICIGLLSVPELIGLVKQ
jgi:hypothetical protein